MGAQVIGWRGDIETDDLYLKCSKTWYLRLTDLDGSRTVKLYPFRMDKEEVKEKLEEWVDSYPDGALVVFHNGLGFDFWALWKLYGLVPRVGKKGKDWLGDKHVQFVDTYILSMYLSPDLSQHSLEYLSTGSEDEKMDFRQKLIEAGALTKDAPKGAEFKQWHPLMEEYCDDDVAALGGVFKRLWAKALEMYGESWIHPSFRQMQKDYWLYSAQAYTGVKFSIPKAEALVKHIEEKMAEIKAEVDPELPPRPLKSAEQAFYKMPSKPWTKSGEKSAVLVKWLKKHNATLDEDGFVHAYGLKQKLVANDILDVKLPMEIEDNMELKQYFIDAGWVAHEDFWNFKRGTDGKPERDSRGKLIKTTPKIQNAGQICPNLLKLDGEIPSKVVKFLSYRNRLGIVRGWLDNWRLPFDGRLSAEISGYAPTSRVRHKTVCNVPKADPKVLLGNEMRDLFEVDKGYWYCGTDAAALENRVLAGRTAKYDEGRFAKMQLEGDPHSFNAFAFYPHLHKIFDINNAELKEITEFKPWRNKAKTGAYLLAFGGGAGKLASSLGLSKKEGEAAYDNYWKMNEGLGMLKEAAEKYFSSVGKNKFLPAVDGRLVSVRGKNVLLSCIGQGGGAIAMSYAACFMDNWLGDLQLDELGRPFYNYQGKVVKRISMVHDEYSWEVEDGVEEHVVEMSVKAIVKAGEHLEMDIPLAGEGKKSFEGSWLHVH